ncbi:UNVERIFIED_CONTAM: Retrovirus-related Pol polyprotein from transposon RE1 [Sesamum angustifolium]|uniref:Retrovirus-related Pol polyprotein from transposon RE1 n=1 Tax=Sesamum angustifolium TaxID=2727405 RepID=A0AAW2IR42_9LAMI
MERWKDTKPVWWQKGYNQIEGVDYIDSFLLVAKAVIVRLLLVAATSFGWPMHILDINNAFLHGYLNEDIYMTPPDGYVVPAWKVCKLNRFLYALKQVSRQWNAEFTSQLEAYGHGMLLTQQKYITDLVRDIGLEHARNTTTPLPGIRLQSDGGATCLIQNYIDGWLGVCCISTWRPDISYVTQQLSQFLQHPCQQHLDAAFHLVKYLKDCPSKGLFFSAASSFDLSAHCDADWASCAESRRSLAGFCIFFGSSLVSWKTKKQNAMSRSTTEAEYRSMGATSCELTWISYLLRDLHIPVHTPILFFCDNKAAIHIVENPFFTNELNTWR